MSAWADPSHISVVPTGVDLRRFHPDPAQAPVQPLVMFVGAMDWMPNVDAVDYFCREIWPAIRKAGAGSALSNRRTESSSEGPKSCVRFHRGDRGSPVSGGAFAECGGRSGAAASGRRDPPQDL